MKRSPLNRVSKKRAIQNRAYMKARNVFLTNRNYCEVFESGCLRMATEIHHINGREGKRLLDESWWLPACRPCHTFLHDHPAYARQVGFLK